MKWIRDTYGVPAVQGGLVEYMETDGTVRPGHITSGRGGRLRVHLDGDRLPRVLHPTWNLRYLDANDPEKEVGGIKEFRDRLVYDPDTGEMRWRCDPRRGIARAGNPAGSINNNGYITITIDGRTHQAHRLAWLYVHGEWPPNDLDHINGNKTDNRICNLREVTRGENNQNIRKARVTNKLGLLGVRRNKDGKFEARIRYGGRSRYLGVYSTAYEAHQAYLKAKASHHACHSVRILPNGEARL